jgi:flagellar motor switch protein FliN/FliY
MDMNLNEQIAGGDIIIDDLEGADAPMAAAPARSARLPQMMRRIPVTLTLEVGSARISLQELMEIGPSSVLPLDALAGNRWSSRSTAPPSAAPKWWSRASSTA